MPKLKQTLETAKKHWLTISFVFGFLNDFLLLNSVDDLFDNLILLFYVLLAGTSLLLFYVGVAQRVSPKLSEKLVTYMPMLMQYSFGGVLSGIFIFYGRSGGWFTNAPFLLLIALIILGNEFVTKRSDRLVYNLSIFFVGLFAYCVLIVPVLIGRMGDIVFIASGILALVIVTFFIRALYRIVPNFMAINTRGAILAVGAIFVGYNVLYFSNIIPPIPLSLTKLEVAQAVSRVDSGDYRVVYEDQPWWRDLPLPFLHPQIHPTRSSIACFSRVFAPTRLTTTIYHNWEYKDANGDWVSQARIGYGISGSNRGGYRGYTTISSFRDGLWRCSVETPRGQVLGHSVFQIDTSGSAKNIVTRIE